MHAHIIHTTNIALCTRARTRANTFTTRSNKHDVNTNLFAKLITNLIELIAIDSITTKIPANIATSALNAVVSVKEICFICRIGTLYKKISTSANMTHGA